MSAKKTGSKGLKTEELLRSYFLGSGFYVVRGMPFRSRTHDLTDIDLWVYERSGTLSRRRVIIDVKDKARPQTAERIFFVQGLAKTLSIEGAGIATSDNRADIRDFARRNGLLYLDGADLQRLKQSDKLTSSDRWSEEDLNAAITSADRGRGTQQLTVIYDLMKSLMADRFGTSSANYALESLGTLARECVSAHPNSPAAKLCGRLCYLAVSMAAVGYDFASADGILRPHSERVKALTEMVRYGTDASGTMNQLKFAEQAVREYLPNGHGLAHVIREKFLGALAAVPAEALAETLAKQSKNDTLFNVARELERAAFEIDIPAFDDLSVEAKALIGACLDFVDVDRPAFAAAWTGEQKPKTAAGMLL